MSQFVEPINLEISPETLTQGEQRESDRGFGGQQRQEPWGRSR